MLRLFSILFSVLFLFAIVGAAGILGVFYHYGRDLPDYRQLAHYEPSITTRVYAGDGRLVAEYATEKRSFVPINAIPKRVIDAFLAAEDKNFYTHPGVDPVGMVRAAIIDLRNRGMGNDRRPVGASTITQQVAKNFLLTNEVSLERKIKEAILAFRIERAFSKDHILELYLNEIYLGQGSYGIAAAALNYFDKGLDELSVAEAAFLGGLPKAPNSYNPQRNPQASKDRRDYVIHRMMDDGFVTQADGQAALSEPLVTHSRPESALVAGGEYFSEDIRREVAAEYGEDALYKGGLSVRSTMDPTLQEIATRVLRNGLIAYDHRHGWRGPVAHIDAGVGWMRRLRAVPNTSDVSEWQQAVVISTSESQALIGLEDGRQGHIPLSELRWARANNPEKQSIGPVVTKVADVLQVGDVVLVEPVAKSDDGKERYGADTYGLRQVPKVEGALVAMDPHTGRVLAMQGGFSYARSQFNRATQALRQPGSSFKSFIYMAALDSGYTPSSLILDAPIEIDQGPGLPKWRPENFEKSFLGPTTMRVGIEKSRNLMAVRMAATLGMDKVASYAERFGVVDQLPHMLSMALGAMSTTPLRMTAAYAQIVNGGRAITPTLIDRIQDREGKTIYRHDDRKCDGCAATFYTDQEMPNIPDKRAQLVDPMTAYQMVHMLEGVVDRGTGRVVAEVGKPLAGKTGTSNESKDTWFVGFSPDLAVGVFVGFDDDTTLGFDYPKGEQEQGATVAAPIFRDFMMDALKDKPPTPFRVAPGIRFVRVDATTGRPSLSSDKNSILEAFKPNTIPTGGEETVIDTAATITTPTANADTTGGDGVEETEVVGGNAPPPPVPGTNPVTKQFNPPAPIPSAIPSQVAPQAGSIY
ncbi:MAG TPA: penicillin-binding protein 1A [Magnetospirillaceae bacterium]|jgi:penicillin-binding protein 1A